MNLEELRSKIENMPKIHHIEILKILKENPSIKLNENKCGIFINLSVIPNETIDLITRYVDYVIEQEKSLESVEIQKQEYREMFPLE